MSLQVHINIDEAVKRANQVLKYYPKEAPKVMYRVLNRVMDGVKTNITKSTTEQYHVTSRDIRETLTVKKASADNLSASVISKGSRRSLADYKLRPETGPLKRGVTLTGAVKKDGGLKSLGQAFLLQKETKQGTRWMPYTRISKDRSPIKPLMSPAIPQILSNPETIERAQTKAKEIFADRMRHEMLWALGAIK